MLTVGVEEEFLLLDEGGQVAPVAPLVPAGEGPSGRVGPEFMSYQLETATPVCSDLEQLRRHLVRLRRVAAEGAGRAGATLVASGMPPFGGGTARDVTPDDRYRSLLRRLPHVTATAGACACHVHVGLPERDVAALVLTRLRPWLAPLLALSANSPRSGGRDTGWSSSRYRALLQSPTFRPPDVYAGADGYDRRVRALIAAGAAVDAGSVYFMARLSPRYPTVEVRIADTCLDVDDAVLLAGIVRALVQTLSDDVRANRPDEAARAPVLGRLLVAAYAGRRTLSGALVRRLLARVEPALERSGDLPVVRDGLNRLLLDGTGAERQRAVFSNESYPEGAVRRLGEYTARAA